MFERSFCPPEAHTLPAASIETDPKDSLASRVPRYVAQIIAEPEALSFAINPSKGARDIRGGSTGPENTGCTAPAVAGKFSSRVCPQRIAFPSASTSMSNSSVTGSVDGTMGSFLIPR